MSFAFAPTRLPVPCTRLRSSARSASASHRVASQRRSLSVRASAADEVKELNEFKEKLRQDLASKQKEWNSNQSSGGGVAARGVDVSAPEKPAPGAPDIVLLNQDNFYDSLTAAGDSLVVVDFFTDWCGPCKLIYPTLCAFQLTYPTVKFYKFNCNKDNKDLGKKLGIKVAPTFHLYRKSEQLAVMTGAKTDQLEALIKQHM